MKTPKIFIPEKDSEPKIEQLLEAPKLPQPEERYKTEIERITRKDHETYEFPLSNTEIQGILEKLPAGYIEDLERIVITPPSKNEDYKNYGRYVPLPGKKGRILLFVHEKRNGQFVVNLGHRNTNENPEKYFSFEEFKKEAYKAVIHEVGHHVGIKHGNSSERFAEDFVKQFSYLIEINES